MPTDTSRRAPAGRGTTRAIWLGLLVVLIVGGGTALSLLKKRETQEQDAAPAVPAKPRPFADLPPETPPGRRSGAATGVPFGAEAGLLADPVWQRAVELATAGEALYQEAVDAKARRDVPTLNAKGNEAKRKLDEALVSTAQLEEDLIAQRGETDPVVRDVQRVRNRWFDCVRWLHKSTAR